jgi:hypothetical protein
MHGLSKNGHRLSRALRRHKRAAETDEGETFIKLITDLPGDHQRLSVVTLRLLRVTQAVERVAAKVENLRFAVTVIDRMEQGNRFAIGSYCLPGALFFLQARPRLNWAIASFAGCRYRRKRSSAG